MISSPNEDKKTRRVCVKTYLTQSYNDMLTKKAAAAKISKSQLIETVLLSGSFPDPTNERLVLELSQLRADLARLGNLQLKGMNEIADGHTVSHMQTLLKEIRSAQRLAADTIKKISR